MSEDKPLSENLSEYHKAISSEFNINQETTATNKARDELNALLPEAVKSLEQLLYAAESESVRMSGIKLVFEYALGKPGNISNEDELSKLINALTPSSPSSAKKNKSTP